MCMDLLELGETKNNKKQQKNKTTGESNVAEGVWRCVVRLTSDLYLSES